MLFPSQVLDLGITRLLVHRLVHICPSMCGDRPPLYGSFTANYNEAYRRLLHLGRRSKASRARPGYATLAVLLAML